MATNAISIFICNGLGKRSTGNRQFLDVHEDIIRLLQNLKLLLLSSSNDKVV
jgi:hypothetical protein